MRFATPDRKPVTSKTVTQTSPRDVANQRENKFYTPQRLQPDRQLDNKRDDIIEQLNVLIECKRKNKNFVKPMARYIADLANIYSSEQNTVKIESFEKLDRLISREGNYLRAYQRNVDSFIDKAHMSFQRIKEEMDAHFERIKSKMRENARINEERIKGYFNSIKRQIETYRATATVLIRPPIDQVVQDLLDIETEDDMNKYIQQKFPQTMPLKIDTFKVSEAEKEIEQLMGLSSKNMTLNLDKIRKALDEIFLLAEDDLIDQMNKNLPIKLPEPNFFTKSATDLYHNCKTQISI